MIRKFIRKSLESLLLESGKVTPVDLKNAFEKQKVTGKKLEEILVEDGYISEKEILGLMEVYLGVKHVELEKVDINQDVAKSVPEAIANKYTLIPISINDNRIVVAMSNPFDLFAIDDVKLSTGYEVEPVIALREDIRKAISKVYSRQSAQRAVEELKNEYGDTSNKDLNNDFAEEVNNAPAVRLVNSIIVQAIKNRASDIHIEPFENHIKIRFRVDGELHEVMRAARETLSAIVTRIKIMSGLNIAERRLPQDGRVMITVDNKDVDLRVSILPTVFGEKIVMRILNRSNFLISMEQLGLAGEEFNIVKNLIHNPYGVILVTGPTGSGKSTTLYTLLNELNTVEKNIITIEDPVEYMMEGINQVNVNNKTGLTFAAGLRSVLRQDPDIIMVGEIRDSETAEIAMRAAITGHLVLSTLHTNDAPSSVTRLMDMGIQPFIVSSSITACIAQRLVRKICPQCRVEYDASTIEKTLLGIPENQQYKLYKGTGCSYCNHTGYYSRTGIFEIMEFTREHKEAINSNAGNEKIRDISIKHGMKTLRESGIGLVLKGITTVDELIKTTLMKH